MKYLDNLTEEEREIVVKFANENNINTDLISPLDICFIHNLQYSHSAYSINENKILDNLANNPLWGFCHKILERNYRYICGAITSYINGNSELAEVASRTITEASFNLQYIVKNGLPVLKGYLFSYIKKEKDRLIKWNNSIKSLSDYEQEDHKRNIEIKEKALNSQSEILNSYFNEIGEINEVWIGNISELFQRLDKSIAYRTVYGMMCSQVHADAGDIINEFLILLLAPNWIDKLNTEKKNFSNFMLHFSLCYYLQTLKDYCLVFNLTNAIETIDKALKYQDANTKFIANLQNKKFDEILNYD